MLLSIVTLFAALLMLMGAAPANATYDLSIASPEHETTVTFNDTVTVTVDYHGDGAASLLAFSVSFDPNLVTYDQLASSTTRFIGGPPGNYLRALWGCDPRCGLNPLAGPGQGLVQVDYLGKPDTGTYASPGFQQMVSLVFDVDGPGAAAGGDADFGLVMDEAFEGVFQLSRSSGNAQPVITGLGDIVTVHVPEPGLFILLACGIVGLCVVQWHKGARDARPVPPAMPR